MSPVVHVAGIRKAYGSTVAVDEVSFDVEAGEIFGLIGRRRRQDHDDGVRGGVRPDRGSMVVLGLDPVRDVYALQDRIGVQLQAAQLQKRITVQEAVDLWASLYRRTVDGTRFLEQLGLGEKRRAWFMTLSGGQKQRLFIALALINDPELVFLDELTTGLDPQARRAIWDLVRGIRDRGKTVFLTTHLMEEAERLCDRVAVIDRGRIVDIGPPAALVRRHCPDRTIVITTDDAKDDESLRAVPGVVSLTRAGSEVTLTGRGEELISSVIECVSERRIRVRDFRTMMPTLEDVFLTLTGHSVRE
jgi:ABC-2 type transport system ATP-binding protein